MSRSPPTPQHPTVIRRNVQRTPKQIQEDTLTRVRRSRSLQLPERQPPTFQKLSPQPPDYAPGPERPPYPLPSDRYSSSVSPKVELHEEELLREAEVVTGFLYGNRSRAAAQALLMHRLDMFNSSFFIDG